MFYSILLAIVALATVIQSDPVTVEVFIRCDPSIENWHGELTIYEYDGWEASDLLKSRNFTTTDLTRLYMFEPIYPGWDVGLEYEIGFQLKHNCTHTGKTLCIAPEPADVDQFGPQKVDFYVRAYENGGDECPSLTLEEH